MKSRISQYRFGGVFVGLTLLFLCASLSFASAKRYNLHGKVVRVEDKEHAIVIAGEAIPGWMGAMTMEYPVHSGVDWKLLKPGEKISATVVVDDFDYYLESVKVEK